MLEKAPVVAALQGRLCFVAKSSWQPMWICWLAPYPYLGSTVVQIWGLGYPAWLHLVPLGENSWWCIAGTLPRRWMLVEVLTTFVHIHKLLHGVCGLLLEGHLPYKGSVVACIHISLIELLSRSVMRRVLAPEHMLLGMRALSFVR
jgi:hypothetical protein